MYTKHQWQSNHHFNFRYLQYLPKDFDDSKKYPLVLFLHGAGEWGDDLDQVANLGYMRYIRDEGKEYPFIMIAPQCPRSQYWACYTESLLAFLDEICKTLPVDLNRVYLTGASMGGTGTWMLAMAAPERFAAIMPVCGTGIYWFGEALIDVPVYAVHGDKDDIVLVEESINMVESVNRRGGNAKLKIIEGCDHAAWLHAYTSDELLSWLLSHKRKQKTL